MPVLSDLKLNVHAAFAPDGPLAGAWAGWHPRAPQTQMALAVADTLHGGGALAVQLAPGAGKTLAYLVPALLWGGHTVVSTATHVLQHQLAHQELPRLAAALGRPVQAAVLKGRSRYVCLQRLHEAVQRGPAVGALAQHLRLRDWLDWARGPVSGDLDDLPAAGADPALQASITSTSESCLGQTCTHWDACHVERARQRAAQAPVVVSNHHLWLGELRASRQGRSAGVPRARALVFDEAHALHDLARHWHTARAERTAVLRFWADLASLAQGAARGAAPWHGLARQGELVLKALSRQLTAAMPRDGLQAWPAVGQEVLRELGRLLQTAHRALQAAQGSEPRLPALRERAVGFAQALQGLLLPEAGQPTWLEWQGPQHWAMVRPGPEAAADQAQELASGAAWGARSVVHTSATLGGEPGLRWHIDAMGWAPSGAVRALVPDAEAVPEGVAWHVPEDLPEPADQAHGEALARRVAAWAQRLDGPVLMLTTTRRAADRMAQALAQLLPAGWTLRLALDDGQGAAWRALRGAGERTRLVVIASGALWRGLDLPGNRLRLVVVDKLPFAPPDDPWLQRRLDRARARGEDPFATVQLGDAAMALAQAAGRLVRGSGDRGLFVVGDVRLLTRAYAPRLAAALQGWRRLDAGEVDGWLDALALTRASTTDRHDP